MPFLLFCDKNRQKNLRYSFFLLKKDIKAFFALNFGAKKPFLFFVYNYFQYKILCLYA